MKKIFIKSIALIIVLTVIFTIVSSVDTIIRNELALTQLENSNELFMFHEMYNNSIRPLMSFIAVLTVVIFGYSIGKDIYKIYKENK